MGMNTYFPAASSFVPDAHVADYAIVAARTSEGAQTPGRE